jgi:hypothetical protein
MICDLCRAELAEADTLILSGVAYHRSVLACAAVAMERLRERIEERAVYPAPALPIVAENGAQQA